MRGAAGFDPDPGRRQLGKELLQRAAPYLPTQHRPLGVVDAMHLKDMLGSIQTNPDNRHWAAPLAALFNHHSLAHLMPSGAVHTNRAPAPSACPLDPRFRGGNGDLMR